MTIDKAVAKLGAMPPEQYGELLRPENIAALYAISREDNAQYAVLMQRLHCGGCQQILINKLDSEVLEHGRKLHAAYAQLEKNSQPDTRQLRYTYAELLGRTEPPYLIDGFIPNGGFVQIFGQRKTCKTFIALDMALCVATGRAYHGHGVQRGKVDYIAAEGSTVQFRDRVTAWLQENTADAAELDGGFWVIDRPVNLTDPRALEDFAKDLPANGARDLIIFDTLSKNSGGVDEDTKGMKLACHGVSTVRGRTGAAVIVIHHEGKDVTRGSRGSTVLPGDVDASLRVTKTAEMITLRVDEARDSEAGASLDFILVTHMVAPAIRLHTVDRVREPENKKEEILVWLAENGPAPETDIVQAGFAKSTVSEAMKKLHQGGWVTRGTERGTDARVTQKGVIEARKLGAELGTGQGE